MHGEVMMGQQTRSNYFSLHLLWITCLLASCAQVVAPGGGPVDRTAPRAVKYSPDSAKILFNSRSIEITFDEYLQLKDLNSQLIISPPLNKTPDISIRNKTLVIELHKDEVLKPNTTYSLFFGSALQDLNENNPVDNFRYIFSTGAYIDSLTVKGKVENAFDKKAEKGIFVMLYSDMSDSMPLKGLPDYFTKTLADGSFSISNVKQGNYRIAAIKDLNANYQYDGDSEAIAFLKDTIFSALKRDIELRLFKEAPQKIVLKKYMHDQFGKVNLYFNNGSDSIHVNALNNDNKGVQEIVDFSKNKDTLTYWIKNFDKDSLFLQVSNGDVILDTVELKMIKKEDALKSKKKPLKLKLVNSLDGNQSVDAGKPFVFRFSQPLVPFTETKVAELKKDTIRQSSLSYSITGTNAVQIVKWDSSFVYEDPNNPGTFVSAPTLATVETAANARYELFIPPGTFSDIYGLSNDSIKMNFRTRDEKYYGSLVLYLKVAGNPDDYIIQLLNERDEIVSEDIYNNRLENLTYNFLHPGKYRVKLIEDTNHNGRWDTGNYLKNAQPEKVIFNPESIMIRSNWDAEIEWDASLPVKK